MDAASGAEIGVISEVSEHFAVSADGETLVWLVQDENLNTQLNISPLADLSAVQGYDIELSVDISRAPGSFNTNIAAAGGRVVIGGFPSIDAPQENAILVITP
jgi:hypothetical protein